jgi:type I restriction enzyme M protein
VAQISFLANIVRLHRGEEPDCILGGKDTETKLREIFSSPPLKKGVARKGGGISYRDIPGLCKVATLKEIEAQGGSLNPGRYVGVAPGEEMSDEDFKEKFETLNEELVTLNSRARKLEQIIARNAAEILEAR